MSGRLRREHVAFVKPKALAGGVKTKRPILGAGAFALMLFSASAAQAQCTQAGMNASSPVTQAADMAVASASASVGALVSSIYSANTAFLTQSSALVGSPANPLPDQQGGGVWARGASGHLSASTTATAGNISFGGPLPGASITCNTRTLEDFTGVQIGTDIAKLNVNGWNLHAGSTIGYLGSKTQDATPATPGLNPDPSFRDSLQIPFVGAYGAASYGGFLVDGQVRGNFFQNDVSDDNQGLSGQHFDARGISLTGNIAYNQKLTNNWFIEPSAGILWSITHVDQLNVPGTGVTGTKLAPGAGFVPPWVLTINDLESTLGRLTVRVGTTVTSGDVVWQPFASASIVHEFQGDVTSSLLSNFSTMGPSWTNTPNLSSTISTSGFGTFGQFGLGVAAQVVNTGWVGYLRGDYRHGDYIEGWTVNGGLRYQFVPDTTAGGRAPVFAKASIYKASPAQPTYNWSSFYIGAYLGADWGHTDWNFAGATTDPHFAGLLGGGAIGYDYQTGKWVVGVEGNVGSTNARGTRPCPTGFFHDCETSVNWLSTATARVGYAYWDRLLAYVKGGVVIGQDRAVIECNTDSKHTIVPMSGCPSQSDSKTKAGWTVGWGTEFGLTQNMSVKSEIMYFDLGSDRYNITGTPIDIQRNGFISTIGLNYRFGG